MIEPIDATFDDVTKASVQNIVLPNKSSKYKDTSDKLTVKVLPQKSMKGLPLFESITEKEIDGIGMGVLNNGMPYLTGEGLARICGVDGKSIRSISNSWQEEKLKPRGNFIAKVLEESKYTD